jgi:hypothetical protein
LDCFFHAQTLAWPRHDAPVGARCRMAPRRGFLPCCRGAVVSLGMV